MSWPTVSLREIGKITTGSTPRTSEDGYYGGDLPFITPAELDTFEPILTASRTLTETGAKEARVLPAGTVMVCCIGSLGKVGISGRTVATNQQINSIVFDPLRVDPRYGFFACRLLKPQLETMAPATTIAIVNKSRFEELKIPLPPLAEQKRIAAILDAADALRAKRRAALVKLDQLAQSIFIEMFGDPVQNSKQLPCLPLNEMGKVLTGNTPLSSESGMFGGSIPFVTPGDLENTTPAKRTLTDEGAELSRLVRKGSVFVCCIGATIGKVGRAKERSAFNQQINAVEWHNEDADAYGFYALRFYRRHIATAGASTTLPILKKSLFEKIEIPNPPKGQMIKFSTVVRAIEEQTLRSGMALKISETLFASLQHRAFKGEL